VNVRRDIETTWRDAMRAIGAMTSFRPETGMATQARKSAMKKTAKKPAKKAVKVAKKAAAKASARKVVRVAGPVAKKAAAKKTASKKTATKKPVAKKTVAKSTAGKAALKKPIATKPLAKKPATKSAMKRAPAPVERAKAPTKAASTRTARGAAPRSAPRPRGITPEQALANTRALLEAKQAHDREPPPWQSLETPGGQPPQPGFQSDEARIKADELHAGESRRQAIQGSVSTQDRHQQGKRDAR
jgi:hypothetical protein